MSLDAGSRQFSAQPFHRLDNDGVVGHPVKAVTPHVPRLELPALHLQYLSKVRRDLRVREGLMCLA